MKSAIITGATSFIGSGLVSELLRRGIECYVIVRPGSRNLAALPRDPVGLMHVIQGDVAKPYEWIGEIPGGAVFFHFAWDGVGADGRANRKLQQKNVRMTLDCLKAAAERGNRRFIFTGSQAEYGICDDLITEDTECHPVIEYGKAKLEVLQKAGELSGNLGIEYVHLRIFSVYGPNDHPWTLVSRCVDTFLAGQDISLSACTQMWNFLYLSDAAEAIADFGDCPLDNGPVYNIAGEETCPLKEYVEIMHRLCGGGTPCYGLLENNKEPLHGIRPDIERMKKDTHWKMKISFSTGIKRILEARGIQK